MHEPFTLLVIGSILSPTTIAIAGVVLALVVAIGGFLVYRSGGKKGSKAATSAGNNDWQRQAQQQGGPGGWNPPGMNNDAPQWAQQGMQQQGGWGPPNNMQQPGWGNMQSAPQQQGASPWSAAQPQSTSTWDNQNNQANVGGSPQWGGTQNGQSAANPWGTQANQGTQQPSTGGWGTQANQGNQGMQAPWEANQAPAVQEPWNQQGSSTQSAWGGMQQSNAPQQSQQSQQPQTAYGGSTPAPSWNQPNLGNSGQNMQADSWGAPQYAPQAANNAGFPAASTGGPPQAPSWQQGGYGQQPGQGAPFRNMDGFGNNDGDKTIVRPTGGLGVVRVEEGKEPGREYKIIKDTLSIGRSRESDIFLEDLAVSRLHASVVNMGNGNYALKDEGSANGTKVNGQLVNKYQTYPLQEGDRIQLGQTVLVFARN